MPDDPTMPIDATGAPRPEVRREFADDEILDEIAPHVATTYDGEAFRTWEDGRVVGEQRAKDGRRNAAAIGLTIGTSSDVVGYHPLGGWIDEFRVSNVPRTGFPRR